MDLREFINKANELGELKEIEGADGELEIGAITYLTAKEPEPPALLFDKIIGHKPGYRLLANANLTDKRTNLLLGLPIEARGLELVRNIKERLNEPLKLTPPIEVKDGLVMQNIRQGDDVDLSIFPAPKWQRLDGGKYIGLGDTIIQRDPEENWVNIGTHRIQVHGKSVATIFFEPGKHGDLIRKKYWRKGETCPVAVTLGGDPFYVSIGASRIPWGMPEYDYIGWWKRDPVKVIKAPLTGLPIPADAEIALEGEMVPPEEESLIEGPFSEWNGHYTPARPEAAFRVKGIYYRDHPIVLAQMPFLGPGVRTSWAYLISAAQLWSHLDTVVPAVKGVWIHTEFGGHHCVVISIEQKYGGHAKQAALAALGHYGYHRKFVVVVDEDIDPSNLRDVLFAVGMRSDPGMWDMVRECWTGVLEPLLSPQKKQTGEITQTAVVILACKPYHWMNDFPPRVEADLELERKVKEKFNI
jgi:UbiD family decarboxylase